MNDNTEYRTSYLLTEDSDHNTGFRSERMDSQSVCILESLTSHMGSTSQQSQIQRGESEVDGEYEGERMSVNTL